MQNEWTEKYRPRSLSEIVGNEAAIRTIKRWAEAWKRGAPKYKAIVLRGEPGTGKTSAALALANDMSWDCIEMNASDHRNAASIKKVAGAGSTNQTFASDGSYLTSSEGSRKLVILDEADNLFAREDYGGAKAIVETIRESGQPIVLIVNDYYELSRKASAIKTLADKAVFRRLDQASIVTVLRAIVRKENTQVDEEVLAKIAQNSGGDARAAINDLQMMVEGKTRVSLTDSNAIGRRNQVKELDESLRTMFGARTAKSARDATLDLDFTPDELEKWIEESVPSEMRHPQDLAEAFDSLSLSDVYLGRTRRLQDYAFWSYAKDMMTGGVAIARKHGPRPVVQEYRFPSHFIMLSRAKGPRAQRESIARKLETHLHTSKRNVINEVLPLLRTLAKNDRELLVHLAAETDLDEGDVAFLLGEEPESKVVQDVMHEVRTRTGSSEIEPHAANKARRTGRKRQSLQDY